MAIEVVPLTEVDIPGVVQVIQQAFTDDPYFKWAFDAETFNKQRNYDSLLARCQWGINNAMFEVAKDTSIPNSPVLGVSCWLEPQAPSTPESWYSWTQGWLLTAKQVVTNVRYLGHGGLRTNRYWIWKQRQQEAQAAIWDDPRGYYFCNMVAVSPESQGRGIGRALVENVTKIADKEGVKCYLESSKNVPNVAIYERLGFELTMEMKCQDGEDVCMLYCMVRQPKTGSA